MMTARTALCTACLALSSTTQLLAIAVEDSVITVSRPDDDRKNRALHGLSRSLVNNAVIG
ncbi:50S ribosomal protein L6, partial [Bacteroides fragilis]|nr:50S ribosomal protein L6 [Bacteroides fragilis]